MQDTFINGIIQIAKKIGIKVEPFFLFGTTGHGARISLAMNVKTGKEIGHPSSIYCWDIVSVVDQCFADAGIDSTLFVGKGYMTRARKTAVQAKREIPANIKILQNNKLPKDFEGQLLIAHPEGNWIVTDSTSNLDLDTRLMPFGPVMLEIHNISQEFTFPRRTLNYLIQTLERGEEPMEIPGTNNYSTISGWKAYARWMQSYRVPLPNIQHDFIEQLPSLIFERRKMNAKYWQILQNDLSEKELDFAKSLELRYISIVDKIKNLLDQVPTLKQIREVYYEEQKTQHIYKRIDTYLSKN